MKAIDTWNLSHNELHDSFQRNCEFLKFRVRGNTWEPITRWLKLDSRIFRDTTNKARITLCDIESLGEIYNYRSIRWRAKKITPITINFVNNSIKNILRKLPILKDLAFELELAAFELSLITFIECLCSPSLTEIFSMVSRRFLDLSVNNPDCTMHDPIK